MSNASGDSSRSAPVPLAIVGIGCLFPKADSPEAFWANIKGSVDAVTEIPSTHWNPDDYFAGDPSAPDMTYARRGAFLEPIDFNPLEFGITPNNIEATDTTQLLGLVVARQALRDAGYATGKENTDGRPFNRERTSVVLGVTGALELVIPLGARLGHPIWRRALKDAGVEQQVADDVVKRIGESYVPWQENSFPGLLGNVAAGRIANRFDLGGSNCVVDAACASSLAALHMAAMELYAGRSDMAITGGIDTFNDIFMYMCFSKTPALSPTGNSRPFSAVGDGTILGEGLGVVVLKRLADAQRDGDRIHAVIRSIGTSSDGKGNAVYAPSADGQRRCLLSAYSEAGVSPRTIELVEAHGTGTKVGDAVEAKALAEVYRGDQPDGTWCALGSVKSMVGHTKAAAGIAGLIKAALALDHKVLPPSIKVERPLENIEPGKAPVYINAQPRPWLPRAEHPRRAAVSAFGFGGSNFHCVLEEAGPVKTAADWDDSVLLLPISTDAPRQLGDRLVTLEGMTDWKHLRAESHRLRGDFRADSQCRLVLVVQKSTGEFTKVVRSALHMLERHPERTSWSTPDGAYFGSGPAAGKLGLVFPGQGSQYTGMLRDLACQFPEFLQTLSEADSEFGQRVHGSRLSDRIYPISTFTDEARAADEKKLADTRIAQPAIGAVSLAAWRVLEQFDVRADAAAGHSFGELVALCAAGRIDAAALHLLANVRGQAMGELEAGSGVDRGSMLAVAAPVADVRSLINTEQLDLVIANKNAPDQVVLSGATPEIDRAEKLVHGRGMRCRRLTVSAAFHSPFVSSAREPFGKALQGVPIAAGSCPVFANATAVEYPKDASGARELLARQIVSPVEFVAEIEAMFKAGVRTFLEVGPGNKMAGLVRAILAGQDFHAVSVDGSSGKRAGVYDLGCALAQLAVLGHPVKLTNWDAGFNPPAVTVAGKTPGVIRLSGANYVKPRPVRAPVAATVVASKVVSTPAAISASALPPQRAIAAPSVAPDPRVPAAPVPSTNGGSHEVSKTTVAPEFRKQGSARLNPIPTSSPAPAPTAAGGIGYALQAAQQSLLALQKMQEQTAHLHQQYLHGQEQAQRTIHQLVEQQMRLLGAACGLALPATEFAPAMAPPALAVSQFEPAAPSPAAPVFSAPSPQPVAPTARVAPSPVVAPATAPAFAPATEVVAAPAPAAVTTNTAVDQTQTVLLEVVADKTGYPVEMLELDMSLDSDLGIDSIKRVEILSALQIRLPAAPIVKPEDLGRIQTLRQIVQHLTSGSTAAPAVAKPAPAVSVAAAPPAVSTNETQTILLEVVADKTGYPVEMLELDMSLDSDLGIDSIKRVEILSALQTRLPAAPIVKPEDLGRIQTLRQIVQHLTAGTAGPATTEASKPQPAAHSSDTLTPINGNGHHVNGYAGHAAEPEAESVLDRHVLTIVPLDVAPAREALPLPKNAPVWITDDGAGLAALVAAALATKNITAKVVPLDQVGGGTALAGLLILAPVEPSADFVRTAFQLIRQVSPALRNAGRAGGAFLATASRLDGSFALNGHPPGDAVSGGLAGLVKTASHEWPEVSCKSLDLPPDALLDHKLLTALAGQIADELLLVGPIEVGLSKVGPCAPQLVLSPLNGEVGQSTLSKRDLVVVTGGARGVTAAISVALAKTYGCNLLLLGRSAEPMPEPSWLVEVTGESQIKKVIASREGGMSPRVLEDRYRRAVINREMLQTLAQIEAAGARVIYRPLDVRDVTAVNAAVAEARKQFGPVRGIVHGAGVLQDRLIEEKTDEQFDEVYSTKVDGFTTLLQAVHGDELKAIVAFSSSTGRFGRRGQVAYAAANEVLNKLAQQESRRRPGCRVLSINWGPWEGGMVTPQLARIFANEGVGLIPLQAGADYLMRELATPSGGPVEIVILGPSPESEAVNGSNAKHEPAVSTRLDPSLSVAFERELDVVNFPFLRSHVIKGRPVLPMAVILEWLAHGAMLENPGFVFHGVDDLRVFKGVVLDPLTPLPIQVLTGPAVVRDGGEAIPVELRSGTVLHARATVLLTRTLPAGRQASELPLVDQQYPAATGEIYADGRLFHGPELQAIRSIEGWSDQPPGGTATGGIIADVATAPAPANWMKQPLRGTWLSDPLAIDAAFQLMILWCFEARGIGSLPTRAARYRQYRSAYPKDGVRVAIRTTGVTEHAAEATIEFLDGTGNLVARIDGYECVMDATLKDAFAMNEL